MLTTGYQLAAARALIGMDQVTLAEKSGVSANTIRNMEAQGGATLGSRLPTIKAVQTALEAAGVEFLNHGQPGVRLGLLRQGSDDATVADLRQGAALLRKAQPSQGRGNDPQREADGLDREANERERRKEGT